MLVWGLEVWGVRSYYFLFFSFLDTNKATSKLSLRAGPRVLYCIGLVLPAFDARCESQK